MNDKELEAVLREWTPQAPAGQPDRSHVVGTIVSRLGSTRRRRQRRWPFPWFRRDGTNRASEQAPAQQLSPIPAANGQTPTVIGRTNSMLSPAKAITAGALIFVLGGVMLIAQPFDRQASVPGAATDDPAMVTEEVEPGVERIVSDGAGHDLEEKHPTNRYDMDNVLVAPDGTVWLSTSYLGSDNDANAYGPLVWALGQPETPQFPVDVFCETGGVGVTCFDPATETETTYLAATPINGLAMAPDGTYWAVGNDGAENGGLYHITFE